MTTTTLDHRTGQIVATRLVTVALDRLARDPRAGMDGITHAGEHYTIPGPIRWETRPGQLDGILSFTVADGTTDEAMSVVVQVAVTTHGGQG